MMDAAHLEVGVALGTMLQHRLEEGLDGGASGVRNGLGRVSHGVVDTVELNQVLEPAELLRQRLDQVAVDL